MVVNVAAVAAGSKRTASKFCRLPATYSVVRPAVPPMASSPSIASTWTALGPSGRLVEPGATTTSAPGPSNTVPLDGSTTP